MKRKESVHYELHLGDTFCAHVHQSLTDAIIDMKDNYLNRNKKDGYDEYWANRPFRIEKVTTIREEIALPINQSKS